MGRNLPKDAETIMRAAVPRKKAGKETPRQYSPYSTGIRDDMCLAEKLERIRRRVKAKGYWNHQHPKVKVKTRAYKGWISPHRRERHQLIRHTINSDNPKRRTFTAEELEACWLALCAFLEFFGGNRAMAAKYTGLRSRQLHYYVDTGRVSLLAADIIGQCDEVPFSREMMRPDLSDVAWQEYDEKYRQKDYDRKFAGLNKRAKKEG